MLLTIKDLAKQLQIKPSTLYAWAAQGKIPYRKIHGLVRFNAEEIDRWMASFINRPASPIIPSSRHQIPGRLDELIARAKREVYTSGHGETISPSPTRKEEEDGAR
jgi:excisionase family DNA binding protein